MKNAYITNGTNGGLVAADTIAHPAPPGTVFNCIQILTDAGFSDLAGNITGYAGVTFTAATLLFGTFSTFTLASGSVLAYYR